jgi:hypothetical protein
MIKSLRIVLIQTKTVLKAVFTVTMLPIGAGFWPRELKRSDPNKFTSSPMGVSLQKLRITCINTLSPLPLLIGVMVTMRKLSTATE